MENIEMLGVSNLRRFWASLSLVGVLCGLLLFAASLTPSLIPRPFAVQGVLSGTVFMTGYALGWLSSWLWSYLELPQIDQRTTPWVMAMPLAAAAGLAVYSLGNVAEWQNSLKSLMGMDLVSTAHPYKILAISFLTALAVLLFFRVLIVVGKKLRAFAIHVLPARVASLVSVAALVLILALLVDKVLIRNALVAMDEVFAELNDLLEPDFEQPTDPMVAGSAASYLDWTTMGRRGREFTTSGPSASDIEDLTSLPAKEPLRIYAGFKGEDELDAQAGKALDELLRLKAFDRSVLIVATPTGTGWMDPGGVDTVEYLHGGDTAIVALQYSYLPSWTTLLIDPDRSRRAARALFREVYSHWRTLPSETRPKLYLFGLSLGALGSEHSATMIELLNDPFDGALWSGPPFPSTYWSDIMNSPNVLGPAWLPEFEDDRLVRFAGPEGFRKPSPEGWGTTRFLYIQHASDPMSFFSSKLVWSSPRWLVARGPDVSPYVRWRPVVTFFQIGFDIFLATSVPIGYGHNFAPGAYIDGWLAVTDPVGWDAEKIAILKSRFSQ